MACSLCQQAENPLAVVKMKHIPNRFHVRLPRSEGCATKSGKSCKVIMISLKACGFGQV